MSSQDIIKEKGYNWFSARYDRPFKDIFCGKENQRMLETLLSSIFKTKVEIQEYLTNELQSTSIKERRKTVDLYIKMNNQYLLLELNNGHKDYIDFRNFVFFSSIINQKTKSGQKYNINIKYVLLNLTYGYEKKEKFITDKFTLYSKETKRTYINNIEIIEFNMDRLMEFCYNNDKEKIQEYKYLMMLDCKLEKLDSFTKGDAFMEEFKDKLTKLNSSKEFQEYMSAEQDEMMIRNTELSDAKEEGLKEGQALGQALGHASGLAEGREVGLVEGQKKLAQELLAKGISKEILANSLNIQVNELDEYLK